MTVEATRQRLQRCVAVLLVAVLPWLVAPGRLQPDTKIDLVVSPARYLHRALWAWNDHTGIGELQNQAYGYLWPMGAFFVAGDAAGMPGWAVQRAWWTLLLVVAFVGAERLARRVAGLPTVPALLAGAVFALSPRVLTVIAEISVEVWPYALAPWLVLAARTMVDRGAKGADRRRGAVATGLLAASVGGVNATVSLVALVPAAAWILLAPRRRGRGRALGWWSLGAALGSLWWLGPLVVLGRYSYPFLDHIEVASTTTAVASVTNVLRGTEHWIAFILTGGDQPTWQSGWVLAQEVPAIIATTAVAGLGLAGLLLRRRETAARGDGATSSDEPATPTGATPTGASTAGDGAHLTRWALALVLVGTVAMAAGRSGSGSGPFAETIQGLLDGELAPLRNVHKADLLVRLPVALGVGMLAHWATRIERGAGPLTRQVVVVTSVFALIGALSPVWQGRVGDAWAPEAVPAVWSEAADEVDEAASADGGTTLVLPGARTADFTWGRVTDEPLRALAASPVLTRAAAPLGHPGATRVLDHVDELVATGRSQPELADGLRRLGVSRVVVRGGLHPDLGAVDSREAAATLEASPGLTRTWSQGEGPEEVSLWELDSPASPSTVVPEDAVVSADASPEGWFALVAAGLLPTDGAVRLTESRDTAELTTDTLRWQALNSGRPPARGSSPTLPWRDARPSTVGTRALAPAGTEASVPETTRFHRGLRGITASSSAADPFAPEWRGAGAGEPSLVDGDPATAWVSGDGEASQRITLRLPDGARPDALLVHEAWGGDLGEVTSVTAGGNEGTKREGSWTWRVPLDGSERRSVTIDLTTRDGADGARPIGVREIELEGGPELGTGLAVNQGSGPVLLTRDPRAGADLSAGEDPADLVRRVGEVPASRVEAAMRVRPDDAGQDLVAAPWSLQGSTQPDAAATSGDLEGWPVAAIDGDTSTRWTPAAGVAEPTLALDLGKKQQVETVRLSRPAGPVTVATDANRYVLPSGTELTIPAQATRSLTLTFTRPQGRAAWSVPEVSLPGVDGPGSRVDLECTAAGSVGRTDGSLGLRLTADVADLIAGRTVPATACGDLPAGDGDITAAGVPGLVPERVALVPTDWSAPRAGAPRSVTGDREHAGGWTFDVGEGERSVLVLSQGANEGWRALDEDGEELSATTIDGWRQGFVLPKGGAERVRVEFTPNAEHRRALGLGAGAAGLLVLWLLVELVLRRRPASWQEAAVEGEDTGVAEPEDRASAPGEDAASPGSLVRAAGVAVASSAVGLVVAGPVGLVAGLLGALVPARFRALAVALVLAGAGVALSVLGVAERQSAGAWLSQGCGAFTLGVLAAALLCAGGGGPAPAPDARAGSTTDEPAPR